MSLKDMKDELRALRKESMKPVSRMRKGDIAAELEKLRGVRESCPPVASTVSAAAPKKMEAKIHDIKKAKEHEFPSAPMEEKKKGGKKESKESKKAVVVGGSGAVGVKTEMKKSKMERLMEMISSMSDSE